MFVTERNDETKVKVVDSTEVELERVKIFYIVSKKTEEYLVLQYTFLPLL